jgi:hypothetical protein
MQADLFFIIMGLLVGANFLLASATRSHGLNFLAFLLAADFVASWAIQISTHSPMRSVLAAGFDLLAIQMLTSRRKMFVGHRRVGFSATIGYLMMIAANAWYLVTHGRNSFFYYCFQDVIFLLMLFINVGGSLYCVDWRLGHGHGGRNTIPAHRRSDHIGE